MMKNDVKINSEGIIFVKKRLRSFRFSMIFTPLTLAFLNLLFIVAISKDIKMQNLYIIYFVLTVFTTVTSFSLTKNAITRYKRIIKRIAIENNSIILYTGNNNAIEVDINELKFFKYKFEVTPKLTYKSYIINHSGKEYYVLENFYPNDFIEYLFENMLTQNGSISK